MDTAHKGLARQAARTLLAFGLLATARRVIERRERKFETTYLFDPPYDHIVEELSRAPGLGLSTCSTIIESHTHSGELSLTNHPAGAQARFSLPAHEMLVAAE